MISVIKLMFMEYGSHIQGHRNSVKPEFHFKFVQQESPYYFHYIAQFL